MTRDDASAWVVFRRLSREEAIEAFAPTIEELVEQLGAYQPGEFVEAAVREPLGADDLRPRLETAAARLGWELRWAPRGPAGTLRFHVMATAVVSALPRRSSRKRPAAVETAVTPPGEETPAPSETGALPATPGMREDARSPAADEKKRLPAPSRVRRPRPTPAKSRPAALESTSPDDAALEEVLADAVGRFGVQAREPEVITWVRMHHPAVEGNGEDLAERVRRVLRASDRFTPGAKRGTWRLARGAA